MSNLGYATVSVIPSLKGQMSGFASSLGGAMDGPGKAAGGKLGLALIAGVAAVGAGVAIASKVLYDVGASFDDMTDTIRIGTGATGDALDSLRESALTVGQEVPANFADVGTAIADLNTRLGLTGDPLEHVATQFLELSRMTGSDLASDIDSVSGAFNNWQVEDHAESLDFLFRVAQDSGASVGQLSEDISRHGAVLREMGFDFDEAAVLMGQFDKAGIDSSGVLRSLRSNMLDLAEGNDSAADGFAKVAEEIRTAGTDSEAAAIGLEMFGSQGATMADAIRQGVIDVDDLTESLRNSEETILGAGEATQDFQEKWQIVKNQVFVAIEPLATALFTAVGDGMAWISETLPAVTGAFGDFGGSIGDVLARFSEMVDLPGRLAPLIEGVQAIFETLQAIFAAAWENIQVATDRFLESVRNMWAIHGESVMAVVSAAWDFISTIVESTIGVVQEVLNTVLAVIQGDWSAAWEGVQAILSAAWELIYGIVDSGIALVGTLLAEGWAIASDVTSRLWARISEIVASAWESLKAWVQSGISSAVDYVRNGWDDATRVTQFAWDLMLLTVRNKIGDAVDYVRALPGRIVSALGNLGSTLVGSGRDLIQGFINGVISMGSALTDQITGFISRNVPGPVKRVLGIASPSKVFAGLGEDTMQGLIVGMEGKANDVASSAASVARRAIVSVDAGTLTNKSDLIAAQADKRSGVTQNITVNYPQAEPTSVTASRSMDYAAALGM